jgi:hypothetical protein
MYIHPSSTFFMLCLSHETSADVPACDKVDECIVSSNLWRNELSCEHATDSTAATCYSNEYKDRVILTPILESKHSLIRSRRRLHQHSNPLRFQQTYHPLPLHLHLLQRSRSPCHYDTCMVVDIHTYIHSYQTTSCVCLM